MNISRPIRYGVFSALAATLPLLAHATPNDLSVNVTGPGQSHVSQEVTLGLNKSMIIDLDSPASDLVITNPAIADAVVQTSKRLIFRGIAYG